MQTYSLKVVEIRKETENTVTLCFKQPGLKKIKYLAGQYISLIFRINGRRYVRPYSFSSCFGIDSYLEVTVKRVPGGIVSNYINDLVQVGDVIEVLKPMGDFIYPLDQYFKQVFLWGVGSGVTPLYSLLKFILNEETFKDTKVHLVYGNHTAASSIFWNALHELQAHHSDRFEITHFHTRQELNEENIDSLYGRIQPDMVLESYNSNIIKESLHYICGPSDLKLNIKKSLKNYQVEDDCVLVEDFELTKNPEDFKGIEDRSIQLEFDNRQYILEIEKGKNILEVALDADIELPYSCMIGNCDSCKATVRSGAVKMIGIPERIDLSEDETLLCCSYPLTEDIHIKL
ncbi:iron-sulfur cluster-binding domain-containing protein [Flavobacterium sufflavum]|uniref:Iron-sulfur cluster-binding domain-containing protein n=1 Tax=Flavobacterium sufflavum TaxID=1921138 RepID=A0A3S2WD54_9FLAO|nr:iron-sulfur cluster-binding domain-containing protein [Flavobacterium sufflavum]RVT75840.1 iron-sulfur cluster-binding domain-containing protein [Flavobacterium sufflavum]